jgi:hypothetical protein
VSTATEKIVDRTMGRKKSLNLSMRFEAPPLALALARGVM